MNVTPDREAPIIPYATTTQGDSLFPMKNARLVALRAVSQVTTNNSAVYERKMKKITDGDIERC
jgi:hypothetical protein